MVAVYALEKMRAEAFELIGADGSGNRVTCFVEIRGDGCFAERPHRHPRGYDIGEQDFAIAGCGDGRMQFMGTASQRAQLLGGLRSAWRLAEQLLAERQRLIRAHDKSSGVLG